MQNELLTTKLHMPQSRPDLVARPHLLNCLTAGLAKKLTLISAPAGFGKTTLLSSWSQQSSSHIHVAWLSLDESDNDLTRFLTYFIAALQTLDNNFGRGTLAVLQSPGVTNIEAILTILLNEIAHLPHDVVLILDDYHVIESQPIDQAVSFLLEHLPVQMHLMVGSRIDPSWPLARLRTRGQMNEVRAHNLRFTTDEATVFYNQIMSFDLSAQDITALEDHTEGWIAGLQLAAHSMQGLEHDSDIAAFINGFTGSNRYIQDYLMDEVLQRQPQDIKEFLLQTSILNRLNASLCNAVTGQNSSQAILETLEDTNLFIVPLDNERQWYRYHHLFADLLKHRLQRSYTEIIPNLHHRACEWYESEEYTAGAFRHAIEAGDTARAAALLEARYQVFIHRGELNELEMMLDTLGPEVTKQSAQLSMAYCWLRSFDKMTEAITVHLEDVRQALNVGAEAGTDQSAMSFAVMPALIETMEAIINYERGNASATKQHAQTAIALIPAEALPATRGLLQASVGFWLAQAHQDLGEFDEACGIYLRNIEFMKLSENQLGAANSVMQIAKMYRQSGRTMETIALCEDMLAYISQQGWERLPPSGIVHLTLATALVDAGEFENAQNHNIVGQEIIKPIMDERFSELVAYVDDKLTSETYPGQPLIEPLSPRELEVLQLIAQGLSNQEICDQLFLALSTVKGHNRNIFDKLQVQRRTEAVVRAHELGLLRSNSH